MGLSEEKVKVQIIKHSLFEEGTILYLYFDKKYKERDTVILRFRESLDIYSKFYNFKYEEILVTNC